MEAMIVVAVIAITAALAAPALSRTMADRRASEATHSMVRLGARARADAMVYGRAMVLRYSQDSQRVEMWRGAVDRCTANVWGELIDGDCADNPRCVDVIDMATYDFPTHSVRMRMDDATAALLCFQPDGDMYVSTGAAFTTTAPGGANAVRFTFDRLESGATAGVQRAVVVPFGGPPRIER